MKNKVNHIREDVIPELTINLSQIFLSSEENGIVYTSYNIAEEKNIKKDVKVCSDFQLDTAFNKFLLNDVLPITMRKYLLYQYSMAG